MRGVILAALAFTHALPVLDGHHLSVQVVDVRYAPGAASKPHRHSCPATVYVIDGAVRSQLDGGAVRTYAAGQSYYEAPNALHAVSANASATKPARFIAYFVCEGTKK